MKMWRGRFIGFLALLALFAPALPAVDWFCPSTGRFEKTPLVCISQAKRCCQAAQHCCCRPVPVPQGPVQQAVPVQKTAVSKLVVPERSAQSQTLFALPGEAVALNRQLCFIHNDAAPSFFFCSRHGPPLSSGRAPPVLLA